MSNPFLESAALLHGAYPFDRIATEHYLPAIEVQLKSAQAEIDRICSQEKPADFENTIDALECASDALDWTTSCYYSMKIADGDEEMHDLAKVIQPKLAAYANDVALNEGLFNRVKAIYDQRAHLALTTEQQTVLEKHYKSFVRNGALLEQDKKQQLREIDEALSKLSPVYSENVLKQTNAFNIHVTDESEVAGLPATSLAAARAAATERGHDTGWVFTLDMPSFFPLMKYADNDTLRKKMWMGYGSRCVGGEFDNSDNIREITRLRYERAQLLGYSDHANYVLEERMAGSPEQVHAFFERLLQAVAPAAKDDLEAVKAFKKECTGDDTITPWSFSYWSEKLKQQRYDFDEEQLRPYFKLENVVEGVFEHARRLFDIQFTELTELPVYHPDVTVYEVTDNCSGDFIGLFYTDFFPRPTKQTGAWMSPLKEQGLREGQVQRPHIMNVCNFTKPTADTPSLLSLDEVETLFHEFGHALHGLLSECRYRSVAGTNVHWDFVELPSQIMENWLFEEEGLALFARHYETGETIPPEFIRKIRDAAQFQAAAIAIRQVFLGKLDMSYHCGDPRGIADIATHETTSTEGTRLFDPVAGTATSHSFLHIFSGGYSAGYYSYKWAEVLDADAFELFKQHGIFDPETAKAFRKHILSRGGSENPMDLYKQFRGREPDPDALLRRDGLLST